MADVRSAKAVATATRLATAAASLRFRLGSIAFSWPFLRNHRNHLPDRIREVMPKPDFETEGLRR
jgi:hypothetical protein